MIMDSSPRQIDPAQLVQLADSNLRRARRRQTQKLESLWLSLQSVILLQSTLERIPDDEDVDSSKQNLTRESIQTKITRAQNDVHTYLKSIVDEQVNFSADSEMNRDVMSDWLVQVLDYFKAKFSDEGENESKVKRPVRRSPRPRPTSDYVKNESDINERIKALLKEKEERSIPPPRESILDKINYEKMLLTFNTATAAKYGVSVLDKRCQKMIEDHRNSNVSFESKWNFRSESDSGVGLTEPVMRRRSTGGPRPQSLNLGRTPLPGIRRRVNSVVSDLKHKAELVRRRHSLNTPVIPWQTAIKQHKSMINEILHDFNAEVSDQNSVRDSRSSQTTVGDLVSPLTFSGMNSFSSISEEKEFKMESVRYEYQSVSKSMTTDNFTSDNARKYSSENDLANSFFDRNGNRHEIFKRGSILDSDIKVTYQKSGSLTPDASHPVFSPLMKRSYSLHSFEPVSPLTEFCSLPWPQRSDDSTPRTPDWSPFFVNISQDDILYALAKSFRELAERNFQDQKYEEAQNLYEQSLAIYNKIFKASGKFESAIIDILKQCGLIRKLKGDSLGAMGIFEHAIGVVENRDNGNCSREDRILIAELWFEMGNALILDGKHSETVGYSVVTILRDREILEFLDAPRSVASGMNLEHCYNAFTTKGRSYPIGALEALSCYQKAYCKVEILRHESEIVEQNLQKLQANVLTKIGDCSILIRDLEVGTNFYENALDCFKATETPHSLVNNAHVLVMIGFLHYINAQYSKALVMLQCATIMFQRMENNGDPFEKVEFALVKCLLCFTSFESEQYGEAVSMGLQAERLFHDIYGDDLQIMNKTYTWLVAQTLFIVAKSYLALNRYETTIETAEKIGVLFGPESNLETILRVRTLELIGICHETLENPQKALSFYNEALHEYKGQINYGYSSSELEHMLLSRTAGLHVSMCQYDEAAMYLDRSDVTSKDLKEDIRNDMVSLLHHLGETHTLASHVDRAIDCFRECIDVYLEIHGQLGTDIVKTLQNLASMNHVKAVQAQNDDERNTALKEAENFYKKASELDFSPALALRYANFLYHQSCYFDAIQILRRLLDSDMDDVSDVVFAGVEQVIAPVLLQTESDDDELCLPPTVFTHYLLVLSFSAINQLPSAEHYILEMIHQTNFDTMSLSVIGYSLIELRLYTEAFHWFDIADKSSTYPVSSLAWENKLFCVALEVFRTLRRGLLFLYEYAHGIGTFPSSLPYVY